MSGGDEGEEEEKRGERRGSGRMETEKKKECDVG